MSWKPADDYASRPVAILGGGILGRRIAACFVSIGHRVVIYDPAEAARASAVVYVHDNIATYLAISRGRRGTCEATDRLSPAVGEAWLVVEAVPEILSAKVDVFRQLETYAPDDCILASNSSSFRSGELLGEVALATKQRVLNTHFMMPPQALIVELMTSGFTSPDIFPFLSQEMANAGLKPFVAHKESSGFIVNRIWAAVKREVLSVIAEGVADPSTIDEIWKDLYQSPVVNIPPLFPFFISVGLDTVEHIERNYVQQRGLPTNTLDWLQEQYISQGKLGNKSDKGGLYPPSPTGRQTQLLVLNVYQGADPSELTLEKKMTSGQILRVSLENRSARPTALVTDLPIPDGIDVHGDRMYWTTMGVPSANDGAVWSARLDGSDVQSVIPVGAVHTPKQLRVDRDGGKLYFCDREGLRVHRSNLDGSQHEIIIQTGDWKTDKANVQDQTNWPVGIAISRRLGRVFWTQKGPSKGSQGRILSASIDIPAGKDATTRNDIEVIAKSLPEPIDLEFDDEAGVLYWTDRGEIPTGNTLNKKTIIGTPPTMEDRLGREIIAQGFGEAIGLSLDKTRGRIYVADMAGRLWDCPTTPGPKKKIYESSGHAYTGIAMCKV